MEKTPIKQRAGKTPQQHRSRSAEEEQATRRMTLGVAAAHAPLPQKAFETVASVR